MFTDWLDYALDKSKKPVFFLILLAHVLYFSTYFGIIAVQSNTLSLLDTVTQTFICVFLLVRFNPLRDDNGEVSRYDKRFIFGSGVLLFSNLVAIKLAKWIPSSIYNTLP